MRPLARACVTVPRLVGVGLAARAPHARPRFSSRPVARGRPDFYISLRPGGWSCFLSPRPHLCASLKRVWCASSRLDTGSRANVPDHGAGDARAPRRAHAARVRDAERRRAARTFALARLTRGQAQPCTPPSRGGGPGAVPAPPPGDAASPRCAPPARVPQGAQVSRARSRPDAGSGAEGHAVSCGRRARARHAPANDGGTAAPAARLPAKSPRGQVPARRDRHATFADAVRVAAARGPRTP